MYRLRRRHHSQNFLRSPELVNKLIRNSSIGSNDLVVEIGSGKGIITSELLEVAGKVIGTELDAHLFTKLKNNFKDIQNLELYNVNFLNFRLPDTAFKVFSNIPFNISAEIVRKLTINNNFLDGYLIVQDEFAKKLIGIPYDYKNQMVSVLLKPWFETSVIYRFSRNDFTPKPGVNTSMIRINRLSQSLLELRDKELYESFIVNAYNREKISNQSFDKILNRFRNFVLSSGDKVKENLISKAKLINLKQSNIQKIHRTRNDKNWKSFKYNYKDEKRGS